MKLKSVRITNFRSIEDSGKFKVRDITCLVGKNEAGKSAVLNAIQGLNPFDTDMRYNKVKHYPRRHYAEYDEKHEDGHAVVCKSKWELSDDDVAVLCQEFGADCLSTRDVVVTSYYDRGNTWGISFNEKKVVEYICGQERLDAIESNIVGSCDTTQELYQKIEQSENTSEKLARIKDRIAGYSDQRAILKAISLLAQRMPKFVYFADYQRMSGEISVDQYRDDAQNDDIDDGDKIFGDFLSSAGTSMEEIAEATQYEDLRSQLEAASVSITRKIFEYWQQNANLKLKFDVGPGLEGDEAPFNRGKVMRVRVENQLHDVTVPFSERSTGFAWFFSFLVHFSQIEKHYGAKNRSVIVLLDEPGLALHAKAQFDLLRYIQEKLANKYQVIYTTHSPFMIIPERWDTIRTVEDVVKHRSDAQPEVQGTKVSSDFLKPGPDTVFPLQGALGYELSQTLFIGKKVLIVEGSSDLLYLKSVSPILHKAGKSNLEEWVICPVGGIDKIPAFISLFLLGEKDRKIVVLTDYQSGHKGTIQRLTACYPDIPVLRCSEFCGKKEADIEDMFGKSMFLEILKKSCDLDIDHDQIDPEKRVVKELESQSQVFSHEKPAQWLLQNRAILDDESNDELQKSLQHFEALFDKINENQ